MQPITNIEERIASELREAIARRRLTQKEAAKQLGTSAKHLSMVLSLKSRASMPMIAKWSERLGVAWDVHAVDLTRTEVLRDRAGGPLSN